MKLVGVLLSPFVRRVAVSVNVLALPFEFGLLDMTAAKIEDGSWIAGTHSMSQADITAAVAFTFGVQ